MKNIKLVMLAMGLMIGSVGIATTELEVIKLEGEITRLKLTSQYELECCQNKISEQERMIADIKDAKIRGQKKAYKQGCFTGGFTSGVVGIFIGASVMPVTGSALMVSMPILATFVTKGVIQRISDDYSFEKKLANDLGYESEIKERKARDAFEKNIFDAAQF